MKRTVLTIIVVLAASSQIAAFDFIRGQGNGMGQTVMLSHSSPTTLVNVPSGGLSPGEWRIETGYNRMYDLSELDQFFLAGAYRYRWLIFSLGVSNLGQSDLYSELTGKLGVAYRYDSLSVGLTVSGRKLDFGGGYGSLNAITMGAGASYRTKRFYAAVIGDNLIPPSFHPNAVKENPYFSLYGEFMGKESFAVTGRITMEKDQDVQLALGQKIFVSDYGSLFWGIGSNPLEFGGGLEIVYNNSYISYAFSSHPVLGLSHTISVSYGMGAKSRSQGDDFK